MTIYSPSKVDFKIKPLSIDFIPPIKGSEHSACYDLYATTRKIYGTKVEYGLGFASEFPIGYKAVLRPRSSIHKTGLILSNSEGVIDADYRGEWKAVFYVCRCIQERYYDVGDRVVQMELVPIGEDLSFKEVDNLTETDRGTGGFGSSGK